jgi:hypothetical protein
MQAHIGRSRSAAFIFIVYAAFDAYIDSISSAYF